MHKFVYTLGITSNFHTHYIYLDIPGRWTELAYFREGRKTSCLHPVVAEEGGDVRGIRNATGHTSQAAR